MLHILLTILKILGILILIILGLVLLILFTVLFVPIRYRASGIYHGAPEVSLRAGWLFRILSVTADYKKELDLTVKIFGIRVYESGPSADGDTAEDALTEEQDGIETEIVPPQSSEASGTVRDLKEDAEALAAMSESGETQKQDEVPGQETSQENESPQENESLLGNKGKAASAVQKIKAKVSMLVGKLKEGYGYYKKAEEFLQNEKNQKTLRLLKRQLFRILRHLLPTRMKGYITLGMEDPCTMGQITAAAAFCYPLTKNQIEFTPVFGEKVMDGELSVKGRIRIGTLLILAGRMLLDRNFRSLIKKFRNRGGKKNGR